MTPTKKTVAKEFQDKKQRKDWKKRNEEEKSMIALCVTEKQHLWNIDSGCSKHMRGDPNKFISLRIYQQGKFTFGDNITSKIIGKGIVAIIDNKIKAKNVLLVEDLYPNLLSVSKTCDQGHIYTSEFEKCEIKKKDS